MKRRTFFKNITLGTAGTLSVDNITSTQGEQQKPTADANPTVKWSMATSWPQSDNITFQAVDYFCKKVNAMTDGDFIITPYPAGTNIPKLDNRSISALKVFSEVKSGAIECGHTASYYSLEEDISLVFRTGVPFGLNPYQHYAWFYYGNGRKLMEELHSNHNLKTFPAGSPGCQMGGWFKEPVKTVSDLKGLRIRIPGFGARVIKLMGAEPVTLGGDEINDALDRGEIDGIVDAIEWQNPYEDMQLKLHTLDSYKYYYYPGFWEPGTTYEIIINQNHWNKLSKAYQRIVETAAATTNLKMLADYDAANGKALKNLHIPKDEFKRGTHKVKLTAFEPSILKHAYIVTFFLLKNPELLKEPKLLKNPELLKNPQLSNSSELQGLLDNSELLKKHKFLPETSREIEKFKEIFANWREFRSRIFQWNKLNELSFDQFSMYSVDSIRSDEGSTCPDE